MVPSWTNILKALRCSESINQLNFWFIVFPIYPTRESCLHGLWMRNLKSAFRKTSNWTELEGGDFGSKDSHPQGGPPARSGDPDAELGSHSLAPRLWGAQPPRTPSASLQTQELQLANSWAACGDSAGGGGVGMPPDRGPSARPEAGRPSAERGGRERGLSGRRENRRLCGGLGQPRFS